MSEPIIEYRDEFNVMDFASKYAERISRVIDEQTLANVEHQLAKYGYVKERTCHWEYPQSVNGWVGYMVCSSCGEKYDETVTDLANYCPNCGCKVVS